MATRIKILLILLATCNLQLAAQVTSDVKDIQVAKQKLQISTDATKYFSSIVEVITAAATHRQSPTARAVYRYVTVQDSLRKIYVDSIITTVGLDDGDYVDVDVSAGGTVMTVDTAAVTSIKLADAAVTANKILGGAVTMDKISQSAATTGQVIKWDGSGWTPSADSNTGTDLFFSGTTSPITLQSSTGSDVVYKDSTGTYIRRVGNILTILNTGDTNASDDITLAQVNDSIGVIKRQLIEQHNTLTPVIAFDPSNYNEEFDFIPNAISDIVPSYNYLHSDGFASTNAIPGFYSQNSTRTPDYAIGPTSTKKTALRYLVTTAQSASDLYELRLNAPLPPGDYTLSFKVKVSSGTDTISYGLRNFETSVTVNTTWQTLTHSFTYVSGTYELVLANAVSALDLLIDDVFLYKTGAAYTTKKYGGHLYMGETADFASNNKYGIQINTSSYGFGRLLDTLSLSDFTICFNGRQKAGATLSAYGSVLSNVYVYTNWWFGTSNSGSRHVITCQFTTNLPSKTTIKDNRWHFIAITRSGATQKLYVDGGLIGTTTNSTAAIIYKMFLGNLNGSSTLGFPGEVGRIGFYNSAATNAQLLALQNDYLNDVAHRSFFPVSKRDVYYISEGTSITNSYGGSGGISYANLQHDSITTYYLPYYDASVSGSGVSNLITRKATTLTACELAVKTYKTVVLSVEIGVNDLTGDEMTYYNTVEDYIDEFRAVGVKVVLCTLLPKGGGGGAAWNAKRAIYNNILRSRVGIDFDALADFDTVAAGADGAPDAAVYYYDTVHPNQAGHSQLASVLKASILSVID